MAATLNLLKLSVVPQKSHHTRSRVPNPSNPIKPPFFSVDPQVLLNDTVHHLKSAPLPLAALTLPFFLDPKDAAAVGGEFGILEGRTFALIHPIVMGSLFVFTLWTGYLGWQWRRVRTIQNEINELKKQVKPVPVTPEGTPSLEPPAPSPIESKIQQLTEERKELIKGSYRDRHFNAGSILLGFGVLESIAGGVNTWFRTGKLFPGPHLFAGAGKNMSFSIRQDRMSLPNRPCFFGGLIECVWLRCFTFLVDFVGFYYCQTAITALWAAAAALVPPMQKGNETARNLHIALNALNTLRDSLLVPDAFHRSPSPSSRPTGSSSTSGSPVKTHFCPTTFVRPTFRPPIAQPQGPYLSPPPPPVAAAPPATVPPPPVTTTIVPTSPIIKTYATSASLPTSPAPKASPRSTGLPVESSSPVPPSPKLTISAPSSSVPPSPRLKVSAPSSSLSSSPAPPPPSAVPAAPTTAVSNAFAAIPTTPQPLAKIPTHVVLPPAQMKSETERDPQIPADTVQKTVLGQETIGKPKVMPMTSNGDFQRYVSETHNSSFGKEGTREGTKDIKSIYKKFSDSEEYFGMRVIRIAGENKGAVMELSPSNKKNGFGGISPILQKKDNPSSEDGRLKTALPRMARFLNSNVQGVNNSMIYNCSSTHNDPGGHLTLPKKAHGGGHG
ncbi:hypothetical protein F0562_014948 [Nyssa sinensis]|uniref:Uncharacterized protein n=1 Tax=Nyssa sinensis TaxID=561372 RepID=A0A5J4ZQQ2_9ASTE|nr:hypothetical protein F0562_014948 [Nyssa sinensis]